MVIQNAWMDCKLLVQLANLTIVLPYHTLGHAFAACWDHGVQREAHEHRAGAGGLPGRPQEAGVEEDVGMGLNVLQI
jgi:hypothetical protein